MYPAGNLTIHGSHGETLEAILKETSAAAAPRGVALVAHPHPLGGGTMHNKVVFRAARALGEVGWTTLRFNFRGVGASTGVHDEGRGELDDVRAALDYLQENYPAQQILLCGFSFGAWVGLQVGITDERVSRLIGIGTPLSKYDFSFLRECRKPLLLVHGERDELGDADNLRQLAAQLPTEAHVRVDIIPQAGHFFDDHLDEMMNAIKQWAEDSER